MIASGAAIAHTKCAVGSVAGLDVGTGANQILQLDGSGVLPVLDGTQLTGIVSDFNPLENQMARLGLHIGAVEQLAKYNMIDQVIDDYEDATGIDAYNGVATVGTTHTITASGNTNHSTTQQKIGATSIRFDGNGDYLDLDWHTDFQFGTNSFTLECWLYMDGIGVNDSIMSSAPNWDISGGTSWVFDVLANNHLRIHLKDTPTGYTGESTASMTATTWHHVAFVKNGTSGKLYLDGVGSSAIDMSSWTAFDMSSPEKFRIGRAGHGGASSNSDLTGYIDELRVSKGVARYTSNFIPSTTAFTTDANTVLLIHSDTTNSSTTFTDSSYTAESGKITRIHGTSLAWK
jgi:hypothetical protein